MEKTKDFIKEETVENSFYNEEKSIEDLLDNNREETVEDSYDNNGRLIEQQ